MSDSYLNDRKEQRIMSSENEYAFISYSSKNQQSADAVRALLLENNLNCWMAPYDIPAGSKYAHVINDAIENCACFVLLLTEEAQASEFVEKEVERAISYRKTVIPLMLGNITLNSGFKFYLGNSQIMAVPQIDESSIEWKRVQQAIAAFVTVAETENSSIREKLISDINKNIKSSTGQASWANGTLGSNIKWKLEQNGDLHIDGMGALICATIYGQYLDEVCVDCHLKEIREKVVRIFIGDGIESIGEFSFYEFSKLTEVYIPYTVKEIKTGAFKNCYKLRHIELPWQLEKIGLYAFENCHSLENFELPDNVVISSKAFRNCYSLTALIKMTAKSVTIFQRVFENCKNLKHIELNNVDLIGAYAFKECPVDFVKISFINGRIKKHGAVLQTSAFASSGVREIHLLFSNVFNLPSFTHSIGTDCFENCEMLTDIYFDEMIPYISPGAIPDNLQVSIHMKKNVINDGVLKKYLGDKFSVIAIED
jgi:hypothetical protein